MDLANKIFKADSMNIFKTLKETIVKEIKEGIITMPYPGGWARWMMGIKEDTYCDEGWVSYINDDSSNSTPEINTTLCVN